MNIRKLLTVSVMVMVVIVMSGAIVPNVNAAASAGDLIKMDGLSSVYYLGANGKRYVFPNEKTYFSWYSDWSGIVTIPQSELETYPLAANVTVRPGTQLVKITTNPTVYAVEPNGTLRSIVSEENAIALWGTNWAKRVIDVPDSFFTNYIQGTALTTGVYPVGTVVENAGSYYYFDGTNYRMFADEAAFSANRLSFANAIAVTSVTVGGEAITGAIDTMTDTSQGGGGTGTVAQPGVGSGLTVTLSSATAAGGTAILGQASKNFATFNLTAANDGDVKMTSFKVRRTGISADATISNAYLYEGATRLTDGASVSSGYITWNNSAGIVIIPAGTTKSITVMVDMAGTAGETVGVAINAASDITTNGATVSGSFPVSGNYMSVAYAALGAVAFGTPTPTSDAIPNAGELNFSVWKSATLISTRKVYLESIRFRQIGSIGVTDLANWTFYVDGVEKGTATLVNNYLLFDFSGAPVTLDTGTKQLEVRADIVNGATRTFSLSLQYAVDLNVKDSEYGAYVKATGIAAASTAQTVGTGTISVTTASNSPSGNITQEASNQSLAKFEFKAYGEDVKVETLKVAIIDPNANTAYSLRNGMLFADGVQVGSTAGLNATTDTSSGGYTTFNIGSAMIVKPGTPTILEVKGDIYDEDGTNNATSTITVRLVSLANAGQKQTSLGYLTVPTGNVDANVLTVTTGTISGASLSSYGTQTITVPRTTAYRIGAYVISGNSTEAVNLNTITITIATTTGSTFTQADLTDMYVEYGGKTTSPKGSPSASNSWSINETLAVNATMLVNVYAVIPSVIGTSVTDGDAFQTSLLINGITAGSATAVNTGTQAGQIITASAGTLTESLDASTPIIANVRGNQTVETAKFKFAAVNDSYTITQMVINMGAPGTTAVKTAILKDGDTTVGTAYFSGTTATFTGLTVAVAANTNKVLTVALELGDIGTSYGTTGASIATNLTSYKKKPSSGAEATDSTGVSANAIYVFKAIPTITNLALPTALLNAGTQTIAKFSIVADGPIEWNQLLFTVAKSAVGSTFDVTVPKLYKGASCNTEVTGAATVTTLGTSSLAGTIKFVPTTAAAVSGTETYCLKATIGGVSTNDYISVNIGAPATAHATPDNYDDLATTTASFIWSDVSLTGHATTTLDWVDDYMVKNLATDSQTMTK